MTAITYNFDALPDRRGTGSMKWSKYAKDILPLWVADMDFPVAKEILEALHKRVDHGIFGYTLAQDSLYEAVQDHYRNICGWEIEKEWIVFLPGVIPGFNLASAVCCKPGGGVMIPRPNYHPIFEVPKRFQLNDLPVSFQLDKDRWVLSVDELVKGREAELLIFCNPHNPVGRCFSSKELEAVLEFCLRNDVYICSDEIHSGLILDQNKRHIPIASLSKEAEQCTITLASPSKTFNIPGLNCAFAIIPNSSLRRKFNHQRAGLTPYVNILGYEACEAAYRHGDNWRLQVLDYLRKNRDTVQSFVDNYMPGCSMKHVEATCLAWIDCRKTGISRPAAYFEQHGVGLSDGKDFGSEGFVRLNFACSRAVLNEAFGRIKQALKKWKTDV